MRRIGILGGTFDPVHNGHIHLAEDAIREADLDEVVMIPAKIQPFKQDRKTASGEDRLQMIALAAGPDSHITVSRFELLQEGVSYTYLTLRHMREVYNGDKLYFITGTDSLLKLDTWMNAEELLTNYAYIVGTRPGYRQDELEATMKNLRERFGTEIINLSRTQPDVSATEIRERLAKGQAVGDLVPEAVERYITEHGLYKL